MPFLNSNYSANFVFSTQNKRFDFETALLHTRGYSLQRKQHSSITLKKTIKELQPPEKSEPIHGATNRWCCPPRATSITGQESIATAIHPQCDRGHMFFSLQGGLSPSVPFSEPYSFQPIANLIATVLATRTVIAYINNIK